MKTALLAGLLAVAATAGPVPAAAEVNYPWCIVTGGNSEGVFSCGYVSLQQCQMTRTGTDMCVPNPRYQASPRDDLRARPRPQRSPG